MTARTPDPWERQIGESWQAFEAFQRYRDLSGSRSTAAVAQALGKTKTLMDRWSARWSWVARAHAYDDDQDRIWREEVSRARVDMARRHQRLAQMMMTRVTQKLVNLDPDKLTTADMERWLRTAAEVERRALGDRDEADEAVKLAAGSITELVKQIRAG